MAVGHLYHAMNYGPRVRDYNSTNTEISPQKHEKKKKVFFKKKNKRKTTTCNPHRTQEIKQKDF